MNGQENPNKGQAPEQKSNLGRNLIIFLLIVVSVCVLFWAVSISSRGQQITYETFVSEVYAGKIERVEFNSKQINVKTKDGKWQWFYNRDSFEKLSLEKIDDYNTNVVENADESLQLTKIKVVPGTTSTFNLLSILYPILLLVVGIVLIVTVMKQIKSMTSRNMDFVQNRARIIPSDVKFDRVAGAEEEKAELEEIIEFLKEPARFTKMGARIPKGVLLVGPPGTGKTLLAKAVAGEANVPFFTISGSDFMELYVGVGASRVRDLFENAKKAKPCIVFIDEIDAVGRQRGTGLGGGNDEREQTLNQLLVQMDGFEQNEGIIVMAATNRADILDPALTRPGRFDRQIYVGKPDIKGREEILKVHAKGKPLASDVNLHDIARITIGFTGADLESLLNEAAILAVRNKRSQICMEDINRSVVKVSIGTEKRSHVISEEDKRITAYHETGHAIVGRCVKNPNPVHEISIIQRGGAAGYTLSRPDDDSSHMTKQKLLDHITRCLGGRCAEMLFLDDITSGASQDIKQATEIARAMITEYGMSDTVGLVNLGGEGSQVFIGRDYQDRVSYSEKEAAMIDSEIKKIIDGCLNEAKVILEKHKKQVQVMVDVLMERETIYSEEIDLIMKGASKKEVLDDLDKRLKKREEESKKAEEERIAKEEAAKKEAENLMKDDYVDQLLKLAEERAKARAEGENKTEPSHVEQKKPEADVAPKKSEEPKKEEGTVEHKKVTATSRKPRTTTTNSASKTTSTSKPKQQAKPKTTGTKNSSQKKTTTDDKKDN